MEGRPDVDGCAVNTDHVLRISFCDVLLQIASTVFDSSSFKVSSTLDLRDRQSGWRTRFHIDWGRSDNREALLLRPTIPCLTLIAAFKPRSNRHQSPDMSYKLDLKPAHCDGEPDFALLAQQMHRPDVRALQIEHLYRLNVRPPSALRQAGHSPVTALSISEAGPPAASLAGLLSWPTALRTLHIHSHVDYASGFNRYAYESGRFSIAGFMGALQPQRHSLRNIYYRACYDNTHSHAHDGVADFSSFDALRVLDVPVDLLWEESWSDEETDDDDWSPADLGSVLPSSLEELVLDVASSGHGFIWVEGANGEGLLQQSKASQELFEWLLRVPRAKASGALAALRMVRINTDETDPERGPLDCEATRSAKATFEKAGLTLSWSREEGPPPLE